MKINDIGHDLRIDMTSKVFYNMNEEDHQELMTISKKILNTGEVEWDSPYVIGWFGASGYDIDSSTALVIVSTLMVPKFLLSSVYYLDGQR